MGKHELSQVYLYRGDTYGPGETEVPDSVKDAEDLSPAFKAELEGNEPSEADESTTGEQLAQGQELSTRDEGEGDNPEQAAGDAAPEEEQPEPAKKKK